MSPKVLHELSTPANLDSLLVLDPSLHCYSISSPICDTVMMSHIQVPTDEPDGGGGALRGLCRLLWRFDGVDEELGIIRYVRASMRLNTKQDSRFDRMAVTA